ncbi:MAG TPA: DUF2252 domain-containing protein [Streptosporangiaceae bacterium]
MTQAQSKSSTSKTTAAKATGTQAAAGKTAGSKPARAAGTRSTAGRAAAGRSGATPAKPAAAKPAPAKATTAKPAAAKATTAKPVAAKATTAKPAASRSTASRSTTGRSTTQSTASRPAATASASSPASASPASASPASASRASTSRASASQASTTRGSSRSTTRSTARPGIRAAAPRTAAVQNGAVTTIPAGVPEGARRTVVMRRSTTTGLEAPQRRLTPEERRVRGKAARAEVPRESHAQWQPPANRPDPVELLISQGESRVPDLVPVRYGRMMVSPFTYYRGAALPMASDLASTPATGIYVQACGDAHLSNFGLFGSPERKLIFDVNDFDETVPGPWEWDVKRLAASLEVAARENGFSDKDRRKIVLASAARYRQVMRTLAGQGNLDVWYTQVDMDDFRARFDSMLKETQRKKLDKGLAKARTRDSMQELGKLTRMEDGHPRIISDPPVIVPVRDLLGELDRAVDIEKELKDLIGKYRRTLQADRRVLLEQYEFTDMARKVVGVGSVGTRCWIILMLGRDDSDPLFLQVKEAEESVLARFTGASRYVNQGERVVNGQRLMQAASDIFLGWQRVTGLDGKTRDFYIRQLRDWKFSVDIAAMIPRGLRLYGELCGLTLARAHARSGDEIAIASYLGATDVFENAIAEFAAAYADQNERDHQAFTAAISSGRMAAERGV